jgi:2-polyprenyl-3-methyl-5-hydroxy-6-metoxy-1,4-benzoquinol methylase
MSNVDRRSRSAPGSWGGRTASGAGPADDRPPAAGRPCPACGQSKSSFYVHPSDAVDGEGGILRCLSCDLVFVDPVPAEATARAAYGAEYYEPWQERREERSRRRLWRRRLELVEARQSHGTLLDVGCGDGLFLKVARDAGWSVEGIEFSPEGARWSSRRLGRPVAVGDLARVPGLRGPFDVVTLWHVLEHLVSPAPMLEAARHRLRPGGLLAVAVPNLDDLPMRAAYRLARGRALPLFEKGAREPHLSHFSPATLRSFLRRLGFERIEIRADRCALTVAKRAIDVLAAILSALTGHLMTEAILAFARRSR